VLDPPEDNHLQQATPTSSHRPRNRKYELNFGHAFRRRRYQKIPFVRTHDVINYPQPYSCPFTSSPFSVRPTPSTFDAPRDLCWVYREASIKNGNMKTIRSSDSTKHPNRCVLVTVFD